MATLRNANRYHSTGENQFEGRYFVLSDWRIRFVRMPDWFLQAVKYGMVGVLNTALDIGLYYALTHGLGIFDGLEVLAKSISYGVGVLNSYFWNRSWTFRSSTCSTRTLAPFVLVNLLGVVLNATAMYVCLSIIRLDELVSLILATGLVFLWNFILSKFVVFR